MTKPPVRRVLATVALVAAIAGTTACGSGGGDSQDPVAQAPASTAKAVEVVALGQKLIPGRATPDAVARALKSGDTVLIAFLADGPAEDAAVRVSLGRVKDSRGVRTFVFNNSGSAAGDLVDSLAVVETPTVAVVDGRRCRAARTT